MRQHQLFAHDLRKGRTPSRELLRRLAVNRLQWHQRYPAFPRQRCFDITGELTELRKLPVAEAENGN
jgi:hypothetical protein